MTRTATSRREKAPQARKQKPRYGSLSPQARAALDRLHAARDLEARTGRLPTAAELAMLAIKP